MKRGQWYAWACMAMGLFYTYSMSMHRLEIRYEKTRREKAGEPLAVGTTTLHRYFLNTRCNICHLNKKIGNLAFSIENSPDRGYRILFEHYDSYLNNTLYKYQQVLKTSYEGDLHARIRAADFLIRVYIKVISLQHVSSEE